MPRGTYTHLDPRTGRQVAVEEFECAAGPAGWRYVSTVRDVPTARGTSAGRVGVVRVDLALDAAGRQVRVEVATSDWVVRGGVAGPEVVWLRRPAVAADTTAEHGPGPAGGPVERAERAAGFAGPSPAFLVAASWLLRRDPGVGVRHVLRLVELDGTALAARTVEQAWTLAEVVRHAAPSGEPLSVQHWEVDDLGGGVRRSLHVAGDVLVAAPGVELSALDSPPSAGPGDPA